MLCAHATKGIPPSLSSYDSSTVSRHFGAETNNYDSKLWSQGRAINFKCAFTALQAVPTKIHTPIYVDVFIKLEPLSDKI